MFVFDSQVHIWTIADAPPAHLTASMAPDGLLAAMNRAGVDRAVIVPHGAMSGWDNTPALEVAAAHPTRFCVMGQLPVGEERSKQLIRHWTESPHMTGIRLSFETEPGRSWALGGQADWVWPMCAELGIPVMVNAPGLLGMVGDIAARLPDLRITVDHLGLRAKDAHIPLAERIEPLLLLSRHPNLSVKASALPLQAPDEAYPFDSTHAIVLAVLREFGRERLFWGSDLSRLNCDYRDVVKLFSSAIKFPSDEDRDWVLGRALARWLNQPVPPT